MTTIEWTQRENTKGETWNPIAAFDKATGKRGWFCTKVSPGCTSCYASALNRFRGNGHLYVVPNRDKVEFRLVNVDQPLRWRAPRTVFVCSMTDLFGEWVPDAWLDQIFAVMALTPQHTYQVLTKRPERMAQYLAWNGHDQVADPWNDACLCLQCRLAGHMHRMGAFPDTFEGYGVPAFYLWKNWPLPNVWAGTSVEDQQRADERIPHLLRTPAAVRFLSCEPLLSAIDLYHLQPSDPPVEIDALNGTHGVLRPHGGKNARIDWCIIGGESGAGARRFDMTWCRSLVEQCNEAGVACFVKQMGSNPHSSDTNDWKGLRLRAEFGVLEGLKMRDSKGGSPEEWPADLRVREYPRP